MPGAMQVDSCAGEGRQCIRSKDKLLNSTCKLMRNGCIYLLSRIVVDTVNHFTSLQVSWYNTFHGSYFECCPNITDKTVQKSSLRESERKVTMFFEKRKQSNLDHTTDNNLCKTHEAEKHLRVANNFFSSIQIRIGASIDKLIRGGMVTISAYIHTFLKIKKNSFSVCCVLCFEQSRVRPGNPASLTECEHHIAGL